MLLPDKHIKLAESLLGLGGFALQVLATPQPIDVLWKELQETNNTAELPAYHSFENLVLAVDFLFSIGAITIDRSGKLERCD
jgi:hypothetical protein